MDDIEIILPVVPAGAGEPIPTIHYPVNNEDVVNAQLYHARIVKRKLHNDMNVTNEHVIASTRFVTQVTRALDPLDEAPAWFQVYATAQATQAAAAKAAAAQAVQVAAAQAAAAQVAQAEQAVRHLEIMNAIFNLNAALRNRTSVRDDADIRPLRGVDGGIPALFPATIGELFELPAHTCNTLLAAYALPIGGTLEARRRRLASHCGIRRIL